MQKESSKVTYVPAPPPGILKKPELYPLSIGQVIGRSHHPCGSGHGADRILCLACIWGSHHMGVPDDYAGGVGDVHIEAGRRVLLHAGGSCQ